MQITLTAEQQKIASLWAKDFTQGRYILRDAETNKPRRFYSRASQFQQYYALYGMATLELSLSECERYHARRQAEIQASKNKIIEGIHAMGKAIAVAMAPQIIAHTAYSRIYLPKRNGAWQPNPTDPLEILIMALKYKGKNAHGLDSVKAACQILNDLNIPCTRVKDRNGNYAVNIEYTALYWQKHPEAP